MSFLGDELRPSPSPARNRPRGNLNVLRVSVVVLFAILAAQLVNMQLVRGGEYASRSELNHITRKDILPTRGLIYDRNGSALVENVGVYTAVITPLFLPDKQEDRYKVYLQVEKMLGVQALQIDTLVKEAEANNTDYIEVPVAKYLTREQALMVQEASVNLPGLSLIIKPGRNYIGGESFSHILGFIGDQDADVRPKYEAEGYALNEPVGRDGVELTYESDLRGQKGYTAAEQDSQGRLIEALATKPAVPGNGLKLSIDQGLQDYITGYLADTLDGATTAAAVVMSPKTGEVYALVSVPGYDNNVFNQPDKNVDAINALLTNNVTTPLTNKALESQAPGSTFKLITAAAALQEGHITQYTPFNVPSTLLELKDENGEAFYLVDWAAHGYLTGVRDALAVSSNHYFEMASCGILGQTPGLGKDIDESAVILGYYARAFGLGKLTGIDITGEYAGRIPSPQWMEQHYEGERDWYYSDTCFMGIGQGDVLASPLQIATMTAAVANGGKVLVPHVLKEVLAPDGSIVRTAETKYTEAPVSAENLQVIREGMRQCVTAANGACAQVNVADWATAGKTGTAEFFKDGVKLQHAWYTGFAPYDDPEVVVTVYYETGWGGSKAAPAAGAFLKYFHENVTP